MGQRPRSAVSGARLRCWTLRPLSMGCWQTILTGQSAVYFQEVALTAQEINTLIYLAIGGFAFLILVSLIWDRIRWWF
jgi:hypothetical protein